MLYQKEEFINNAVDLPDMIRGFKGIEIKDDDELKEIKIITENNKEIIIDNKDLPKKKKICNIKHDHANDPVEDVSDDSDDEKISKSSKSNKLDVNRFKWEMSRTNK